MPLRRRPARLPLHRRARPRRRAVGRAAPRRRRRARRPGDALLPRASPQWRRVLPLDPRPQHPASSTARTSPVVRRPVPVDPACRAAACARARPAPRRRRLSRWCAEHDGYQRRPCHRPAHRGARPPRAGSCGWSTRCAASAAAGCRLAFHLGPADHRWSWTANPRRAAPGTTRPTRPRRAVFDLPDAAAAGRPIVARHDPPAGLVLRPVSDVGSPPRRSSVAGSATARWHRLATSVFCGSMDSLPPTRGPVRRRRRHRAWSCCSTTCSSEPAARPGVRRRRRTVRSARPCRPAGSRRSATSTAAGPSKRRRRAR